LKNRLRKKAAVLVCLFLLSLPVVGQDLVFDSNLQQAYDFALTLNTEEALKKIADETLAQAAYVASLAETIELLVTEDNTKFAEYEERFLKRVDRNLSGTTRDYQFVQAELRLQWAFVYLKFGHELDAALRLRQAYVIAEGCREKFPDYLPIRKTTGLLSIIIGSVPDKYQRVFSLLNMNGSVSAGLADLNEVSLSNSPLALESKILFALVEGFILTRPESALEHIQQILAKQKDNRLLLFFSASFALKDSQNDLALQMLDGLSSSRQGLPLYYADYLRGEAYHRKGDYLNSVASYRWFISHQTGENYLKDAYYKIGLNYLLHGNENDALDEFNEARTKGKEATEADKAAASALAEKNIPNIMLLKVRHFTDGGYFSQAEKVLAKMTSDDLIQKKDQVEYYYRKARLAHKMNQPGAVDLYLETIRLTGQDNWYFAPNSCLQLGYLYQSQGKVKEAEEYFLRALSYRRHEYKNSIDSKARSALAQLGRI
jgi:hypothetical protein